MKLSMFVDLNALRQNLRYLKSRADVKLLFMVKANAYGHGVVQVAKASESDVDFFGVATVEEGVELRKIGIKKPILVSLFAEDECDDVVQNDLSVVVFSEKQLLILDEYIERLKNKTQAIKTESNQTQSSQPQSNQTQSSQIQYNQAQSNRAQNDYIQNVLSQKTESNVLQSSNVKDNEMSFDNNLDNKALYSIDNEINNCDYKVKVHLKLDTGMNRLGVKTINELEKLIDCAKLCQNIEVEGCCTHLYNVNAEQYKKFDEMTASVKDNFPSAYFHISSSDAVCKNGADSHDMVRVGLSGYGYGDENLKAVMCVSSSVVAVKEAKAGEHIGYGEFIATKDCNLAVVFGGYADGISQNGKGYVVIRNQLCKILSVVCMDMTIVETVDFLAEVGESVKLICKKQTAEVFARDRDMITYEALTGFSRSRCERIYFN